jgi:cytochrome c553
MFYLALTQKGSYYDDAKKEETKTKQISEEERKLSEFQKSAIEVKSASKLYISKCSACHSKNGRGIFDDKGDVVFPPIAAKPYEFILQRVYDYKEGRVANPLMITLLQTVSDENLKVLADEISKFEAQ